MLNGILLLTGLSVSLIVGSYSLIKIVRFIKEMWDSGAIQR